MKKLLTPAFVLVILLLAAAELASRLFFPQDVSGRFEYGYSPDAGFVERPDGTVQLTRAGGRRFLPQSFARHRPDGAFRIFVIGDSVPRGPGLKKAYPWQVADELRRHQVPSESFNLGLAGHGSRRSQLVLQKVLEYEPSLIILHVNNSTEFEDDREYRRSQEFKSWHPKNWLMKSFIFRRLYELKTEAVLWRLLPDAIRTRFAADDAGAKIAAFQDKKKLAEWKRQVAKNTAASVNLALRKNVPILVVSQCRLKRDAQKRPFLDDYGLDALGHSLEGEGVYTLSMKEVFSPVPDFPSYFADGAHLKPAGHAILAHAIFQKIYQEHLAKKYTTQK
jgi:hypothetical protein